MAQILSQFPWIHHFRGWCRNCPRENQDCAGVGNTRVSKGDIVLSGVFKCLLAFYWRIFQAYKAVNRLDEEVWEFYMEHRLWECCWRIENTLHNGADLETFWSWTALHCWMRCIRLCYWSDIVIADRWMSSHNCFSFMQDELARDYLRDIW